MDLDKSGIEIPNHLSDLPVRYLETRALTPHPLQPRKRFERSEMEELEESILAHGILTPLLVTMDGEHNYIVSGERRWLAAISLGIERVPCLWIDGKVALETLVATNAQRRLSFFEQSWAAWLILHYALSEHDPGLNYREAGEIIRYVAAPSKAKVHVPDWVLANFPTLQKKLPQHLAQCGLTLPKLAEFIVRWEALVPEVQQHLHLGTITWRIAIAVSPWARKMRKRFPGHPGLETDNIREFLKLVGRSELKAVRQMLKDETLRLMGTSTRPPARKQALIRSINGLYKRTFALGDRAEAARAKLDALEAIVEELEELFSECGVNPWEARRRR